MLVLASAMAEIGGWGRGLPEWGPVPTWQSPPQECVLGSCVERCPNWGTSFGIIFASRNKVLVSDSFFPVRSESVTWVTGQILEAAIQARCGVTPGNGEILEAAKLVTCPPPA